MQTLTMTTQTVKDIPMRWHETGDGTPVVFIHGIPTGPDLWRHVLPKIKGAKCYAWEMVGYAGSIEAGRNVDISVKKQAEYLIDWMDALGIEEAIFAGQDLGGGVAQIAAVQHPDRCAGLFLTNAIAYDSWPIPSVKALRATTGVVRHLPDSVLKMLIGTLFQQGHETPELAKEAIAMHYPPYADADGAEAMARQVAALNVNDTMEIADGLPVLDIPARLAWGVDDGFQKVEYGERLSLDLSAPLRRIEGGKHFTPEDHPDIIAEEVNTLIAESMDAAGPTAASEKIRLRA